MQIDKELLERLFEQAKDSPRLRMNYDLRTSSADTSQRMLNAIESIETMGREIPKLTRVVRLATAPAGGLSNAKTLKNPIMDMGI